MSSKGTMSGASGEIPEELKTPNYRIAELEGIGYDEQYGRQDPSNVIKVGDTYHVYISKYTGNTTYTGVIGHATSTDGVHWQEQADAITKRPVGAWDGYSVLTPLHHGIRKRSLPVLHVVQGGPGQALDFTRNRKRAAYWTGNGGQSWRPLEGASRTGTQPGQGRGLGFLPGRRRTRHCPRRQILAVLQGRRHQSHSQHHALGVGDR